MSRKWQGTALFAAIMTGIAITVGGRMLAGSASSDAVADGTTESSAPATTPSTTATPSTSASASASASNTTVTGDSEQTPYGAIQVSVTFAGTKITGIGLLQSPTQTPRDEQITAVAVPQLEQAILASQSAQVDTISGATYTSQGYLASVQSAIDAHL